MNVLQLCMQKDSELVGPASQTIGAMVAAGHNVTVGYLGESFPQRRKDAVTEIGFGFDAEALRSIRRSRIADDLVEFCRDKQIEVIITHRYKPFHIVSQVSVKYPLVKKIAVFHGRGEFKRFNRKLFARLHRKDWQIVTVSSAVRDDMLASRSGFAPEQVHVIPNAIDFDRIAGCQLTRAEAREKLGIPPDRFVVGTIGRLVPKKGHSYLIKASKLVSAPLKLVIIGEGRERPNLEELIKENQLSDSVLLQGSVDEAFRYVKAFDLFVFPSIEEAFGVALLEAIAGGVPVIGTRVGGIPEVLGEDAMLADPESEFSLAVQIQRFTELSVDDRLAYQRGIQGRAKSLYDISAFTRSYKELLENISSRPECSQQSLNVLDKT